MERLNMARLMAWKTQKNRKPLLVTGVRQCGKTYLLREFGAKSFQDVAYFNFDGDEGLKSLFEYDFKEII